MRGYVGRDIYDELTEEWRGPDGRLAHHFEGVDTSRNVDVPDPMEATRMTDGKGAQSTGMLANDGQKPTEAATLEKDIVFGTLKNSRRREALRFIRDAGGDSTMRDLSEHIAAIENEIPVGQISSKQRKRVYVSLYQVHLPSMDRDGVVVFNKGRGTVELTEPAAELYPYLDGTDIDTSHGRHYLSLTGFGGLLYLFGAILLGPGSVFVTATVLGLLISLMGLAVLDLVGEWPEAINPATDAAEETAFGIELGAD